MAEDGSVDQYAASVKNAPRVPAVIPPTTSGEAGDTQVKPYLPPHDPLDKDSKERARVLRRDIPITIASSNWDYPRVRAALESHAAGLFFESAQLWEMIEGDDRVQAVLGSRIGALSGLPCTHTAPSEDDGKTSDEATLDVVLDAWQKAYPKLVTREVISQVKRWAIGLGFAIAQVQWDTEVTPWQPYLKVWHPQFVYYRWDTRSFWVASQDGSLEVTPGDGTWFLHAPNGAYRGWMYAAIRALAIPWLLRQQARRDWARYNEIHGTPMLKAIVPAVGYEEAKQNFISALQNIGQEAVVELPQNVDGKGFDLSLLEASDRAWEAFKGLIDQQDSAITLTLAWQNLTTEVKEGSFAAARVHGDVKQTCLEFDESTFVHDVHNQLARPFALFNFGDADDAPYTHYKTEPIEDEVAKMAALVSFSTAVMQLRSGGVAFDLHKLAQAYGVKLSLDKVTEDKSKAGQVFEYHFKYGLIRKNEGRELIGLPPVEGGEEFVSAATVVEDPNEPKPEGGGADAETKAALADFDRRLGGAK